MSEIVYDVTRLTSRFLNATPNGIDRVDMTLASHFLRDRDGEASGAVFVPGLGHFALARSGAIELLDWLDGHFGERDAPAPDPILGEIIAWLSGGVKANRTTPLRLQSARGAIVAAPFGWAIRHAALLANDARRTLSRGAVYLNVSQYPLARQGALDWLAARRDIKPVFYIHDMLPIETPEYFRPREFIRHHTRLRQVARFAAGVVVSTGAVKQALLEHLDRSGRGDLPILVAPPPVSPLFRADGQADDALGATPYCLQCGTLEPRKNHLLTLHVWRELVARHGRAAPKLVIVGARGWENENVVDLLERCPALRAHVLEVSGLSTPSLVSLMRGARALLMPSFAEGYGLPVAEALALGVPVIASDIPVFREVAGSAFIALSPIDGEGWLRAVEAMTEGPAAADPATRSGPADSKDYFRALEAFVGAL